MKWRKLLRWAMRITTQAMGSQNLTSSCVYCSSDYPNTDEHVIPRGWFPKDDPIKQPIIVRACYACNNEKSKNDEWLRKWFTSLVSDQSQEASKVLHGPVARSIRRQPKLGKEMMDRMTLVDVFDNPTHLWLGRQTRVAISIEDWNRIFGWVDHVIRGSYAWDKKEAIPHSYEVLTFFACDEWFRPKDFINPIISYMPFPHAWHLKDAKVFMFGRAYVSDDPRTSVWITCFYNRATFVSFVGKREWVKEQRKARNESSRINQDQAERYIFRPAE